MKSPLPPAPQPAVVLATLLPLLIGTVCGSTDAPTTAPPPSPTPAAETPASPNREPLVIRNARALWEQGKLPAPRKLQEWLQSPSAEPLRLPPRSTTPLSTREIAKRASTAYLRVGWVFQCTKCSNWHTNLAGGYAIAPNAVATAHHVLARPERMKDDSGYLIVVKGDHEVLAVSGVLGADATADAALLRVETAQLHPLPLTEEVEVGDPVFCLSEPSGERPYFSAGIVNRFARDADVKKNTPRAHRINVSTDWAPGSSGSAVLDACGNAIGHVGSISSLGNHPKGNEKPAHYMTLHWAIPAKHVLELARTPATRAETATTSDPAR